MYKTRITIFALIILCFSASGIFAQECHIVKTNLSQTEIDRIIKNFTTKEGEFREALKNYIFDRDATIQTVGMGGQITGTYHRDSSLTFNDQGKRFEKITYFPVPTITEIQVTPEDLEDLGGINPFALDPSAVNLYNFIYLGKEKIDELNLYVFDVAPKVMPDPKSKIRVFTGRIWVDDQDLQIVKSKGKAGPEYKNNRYPVVETWRENIEGKYWFPLIRLRMMNSFLTPVSRSNSKCASNMQTISRAEATLKFWKIRLKTYRTRHRHPRRVRHQSRHRHRHEKTLN